MLYTKNNIYIFIHLSTHVQNTFDAGLNAFETEGISRVTALKEELVKANHQQTDAIIARHDGLLSRYVVYRMIIVLFQKKICTLPPMLRISISRRLSYDSLDFLFCFVLH